MSSDDPTAVAISWLDAYRAASLSILDLYADDASLECACNGGETLCGRAAIEAYWRRRFVEAPACDLVNLQRDGRTVAVSYTAPGGTVQAILHFNESLKIVRSQCGPLESSKVVRMWW